MFENASTQELLSDSQRTICSTDSALFSLSQRQHSQSEFSQVRTQDLFTQNLTGSSQSERSYPQTRKMSMYDKWMSKGPMYKKDPVRGKQPGAAPLSFQPLGQQIPGKTRDSEDRELMQQVIIILQDCNKEVKNTLTAVKEKLESHSDLSDEKLTETMKAFLEDIWKHEDRMLQAVQEKNQSREKIQELEKQLMTVKSESKEKLLQMEKQLAVKDAELKQLQLHMEEKGKPSDLKQVAKAVRQELLSPQLAVENKLMEILEATREASEQQNEQLNQYQHQLTTQSKQYNEWKALNQKLVKDMEKRFQKDITALRKDLHTQEQDWQNCLQTQLAESSAAYIQDMEKLIERMLSENANQSPGSAIDCAKATSTIAANVKKELQQAIQKQTKAMEKNVQTVLNRQLQKQQEQLQNLHRILLDDVAAGIESATEQCRERDEPALALTAPVFEEKFDVYHANIQQQIQEMHRQHVEEVSRIQKEIEQQQQQQQRRSSTPNSALKSFTDHAYVPKTTGYQLKRSHDLAKLAPLTEEEKANLFSKKKTVQLKTSQPKRLNDQLDFQTDHERRIVPAETKTHELVKSCPPKKKKKSSSGCRKKKKPATKKIAYSSVTRASVQSNPGYDERDEACPDNEISFRGSSLKSLHQSKIEEQQTLLSIFGSGRSQSSSGTIHQACRSRGVEKEIEYERVKKQRPHRTMKKTSVYEFSEEKSPDQNWWHIDSFQAARKGQRNLFGSPEGSAASSLSSPAMSVTVDKEYVKVDKDRVVVRRSRWQTTGTPQKGTMSAIGYMQGTRCETIPALEDPCKVNAAPALRSRRKTKTSL